METNAQQNMDNVVAGGACLVDWELYGSKQTPAALRLALQAHGFDPSVVPDLDQTARVRSAGKRWSQGR